MFSLKKEYPIGAFTDEWCFEIVLRNIGWYPAIYHIQRDGKRVFKHNNCLPCKNMNPAEMEDVRTYFPDKWEKAMELSDKLKKYWGRDEAAFYATFGRDLGQESTCGNCQW